MTLNEHLVDLAKLLTPQRPFDFDAYRKLFREAGERQWRPSEEEITAAARRAAEEYPDLDWEGFLRLFWDIASDHISRIAAPE